MPRTPFAAVLDAPVVSSQPPSADLAASDLTTLAARLRARETTAREVVEAYLSRIDRFDPDLHAFLTVDDEGVLAAADRADDDLQRGRLRGPLHGVPLAIKDVLDTAGQRTTGGTTVLGHWHPPADAVAVGRLRTAGALALGKTNLHEYAFGITSVNPHYGAVRNPYDQQRIAGGSSGGTAAAVAAGLAPAGIGTDTGGSVRIPMALCGGVGLRPTLGRVPRVGMMGLSWTCDAIGPMTRSVADGALLLAAMAGSDDRDPATAGAPKLAVPELTDDPSRLHHLRVGVAGGFFGRDNDGEVDRVFEDAQRRLRDAGATLIPVEVAAADTATPLGFSIVVPETVTLIREYWSRVDPDLRLEDHLDDLGRDLQIVFGGEVGPQPSPVPAHAYLAALRQGREAVRAGYLAAFDDVDVVLTPATPAPAVPLDQHVEMQLNGRAVATFATFVRYQFGVSLAGLPAIAVPGGQSTAGLPVGVQFVAPPWQEARLITAAHAYELVTSA